MATSRVSCRMGFLLLLFLFNIFDLVLIVKQNGSETEIDK